jgi:hypothetical protein
MQQPSGGRPPLRLGHAAPSQAARHSRRLIYHMLITSRARHSQHAARKPVQPSQQALFIALKSDRAHAEAFLASDASAFWRLQSNRALAFTAQRPPAGTRPSPVLSCRFRQAGQQGQVADKSRSGSSWQKDGSHFFSSEQ